MNRRIKGLIILFLINIFISINVKADVTSTTGGTIEIEQSVIDNTEYISTPMEVTGSVYGLRFTTTDNAVITAIKISDTECEVTETDGYYQISDTSRLFGTGRKSETVEIHFKVSGATTITLSQWGQYQRRNWTWTDVNTANNTLTITIKDTIETPPALKITSVTPQETTYERSEVITDDNTVTVNSPSGGNMEFIFYGDALTAGKSISITFSMNDYAAENLRGICIDTTSGNCFTVNSGDITNNSLTKSNNGSWTTAGALFAPNEQHEVRFQLKNTAPSGIAKIWISEVIYDGITLTGSEDNATYLNVTAPEVEMDAKLIIHSVTPQTTTYELSAVSTEDDSVDTTNPAGGEMTFEFSGNELSAGQSISITLSMNDYAAAYLRAIYIDSASGNRFTIGSGNNIVSGNSITLSNTGSWTTSGALFAPNEQHTMRFQLQNSAESGLAKIWISEVIYDGITLTGSEDNATYLNVIAPNVYLAEQEKSYAGAGNKNEPLFRVRGNFAGDNMPTIKFTPYFDEGMITRLVMFIRKVPTDGDIFFGSGFTDVGIFDYRHPMKDSRDCVYFAGYINNPTSGEQIEFTVPENAFNTDLKYLLSQGNYYIYVTADVASNAPEFLGDGNNTRNAIGAILDELIVNGTTTEFTHISYSNNKKEEIPQAERTRNILKKRVLLYRPYDGYSKYYRIPSITTASDGTLVTTSDARLYHNHDVPNDFDILSCYSTDDGLTWSNHTIIAKGTGWDHTEGSGETCSSDNVHGYGDCAISQLHTPGNVLAVFIGGAGLHSPRGDGPTIYYNKSINSGISWWSEPKMIPQEVFDAGSGIGTDLTNAVACPGPGRMCYIKDSGTPLDSKVVFCAYVWNNGSYSGCPLNFLAYDESNDTWENIGILEYDSNFSPGESQLAQIDDRTLILTCRDQTSQQIRTWHLVNINDDGTLSVGQQLTHTNFSTDAGTCNSNFIVYKADDVKYLIQAMPVNQVQCIGTIKSPTRQNIWVKYANLTDIIEGTSTQINWIDGVNITLNQGTGGYSCLTQQLDGTIGIMVEEYPVAYRNIESDTEHCTNSSDVLLASWYMSTTFENITNNALKSDEIRQIEAPKVLPETTAVTIDENHLFNQWNYNDDGTALITTADNIPECSDDETYYIQYQITLEQSLKTYYITTGQSIGDNVAEGTIALKEIVNKYLTDNSMTLSKGDIISLYAQIFIKNSDGDVVANSVETTELYNIVDPGRKIILKVMPKSFDMNPRLITPIGEYTKNTEVYVSQDDVITLHQGNIPQGMLADFLGFSINGTTYEELDKDLFGVTTFDDISQINVTIPNIDAYEGDSTDDNLITFYAWYGNITGGIHIESNAYYDTQDKSVSTAVWHNEDGNFDIETFDISNDFLTYPESEVNINSSDILYGYKGWYNYSYINIDYVVDSYTYRKSAVTMLWYKKDGQFVCDSDSDGNVYYRNINGLNSAGVIQPSPDNPWIREINVGQYASTETVNWYTGTNPSKASITIPTGMLLDGIEKTAVMGKIVTYIVEEPLTQEQANALAALESARINTPDENPSIMTAAEKIASPTILYLVEQRIVTNSITTVENIDDDRQHIVVQGNSVVWPEDSEVFSFDGRKVNPKNLNPSIYIVKSSLGVEKIIIEY